MEPTNGDDNKPQSHEQEPLPLRNADSAPAPEQVLESASQAPIIQENIGGKPSEETPSDCERKKFGEFERLSLRWARLNAVFVGLTLFAITGTAVVFWDQFKEMSSQTDILAIAARQARRDSAESSANAARQLSIAQEQAKAAQDSVNAIQRQTEIGARPWLELSKIAITGGMTIDINGEAHSQVYVVATNVGKTPAREVSLWVELGERSTERQEIRRLCTMNVPTPKDAGKYGQILFPTKTLGEEETQTISIKLRQLTLVERKPAGTGYSESFRWDKGGPPPSQEQFIYPNPSSVIGCIQYKSFTSEALYYTGFVYELLPLIKGREMFGYNIHFDRKTKKATDIPATITQENGTVTIPLDWLRLTQNRGWGNDIVK